MFVDIRSFRVRRLSRIVLVALGALALVAPASAQWLQWGGPDRNFRVHAGGLSTKWPDDGPKQLWSRDLGDGYSTILADGDVLFVPYRVEKTEFVAALSARDGKTIWEFKYDSPFTPGMEQFGPGPHSTPIVVGDRLYTVGVNAVLHCFDKKTGKVVWMHDLAKEFGGDIPGRGYSCSPIAYKNSIILSVGSPMKEDADADAKKEDEPRRRGGGFELTGPTVAGQAFMAFDLADGKLLWKNQSFLVGHSSPILIQRDGKDELVAFTAAELVGLNPENGELRWSHPHKTQFGANISTPVWCGDNVIFCSAGYRSGSRAIRIEEKDGKATAKELWYADRFGIHFGNAICLNGRVYGSTGDFGPSFFCAVDLKTGETLWRSRDLAKSTFVEADGKFIIIDEDGQLAIATPTDKGLEVHSQAPLLEGKAWTAPTLVGKILYVRDRKRILALDLG